MRDKFSETVKLRERTIKINLTDADCEQLSIEAGKNGLTVAELLENFIGDLVNGTHSNGSDERDAACAWIERCQFGIYCQQSLLEYLLEWEYDPEHYIDIIEDIETAEKDKKDAEEHPEEYNKEEISYIDDDVEQMEEELQDMLQYWDNKEADMKEEINKIKEWAKEKKALVNKV